MPLFYCSYAINSSSTTLFKILIPLHVCYSPKAELKIIKYFLFSYRTIVKMYSLTCERTRMSENVNMHTSLLSRMHVCKVYSGLTVY